jgi:hypothetical protein
VPGGGLSLDGQRWIACKSGFFLPVRVLSRLFRRLFLQKLSTAHHAGRLQFFGQYQDLAEAKDFAQYLSPLRQIDWVVYAKRPFAGPEAVLATPIGSRSATAAYSLAMRPVSPSNGRIIAPGGVIVTRP